MTYGTSIRDIFRRLRQFQPSTTAGMLPLPRFGSGLMSHQMARLLLAVSPITNFLIH